MGKSCVSLVHESRYILAILGLARTSLGLAGKMGWISAFALLFQRIKIRGWLTGVLFLSLFFPSLSPKQRRLAIA